MDNPLITSFEFLNNRLDEIEKRLDKIEGKKKDELINTVEFVDDYINFKDIDDPLEKELFCIYPRELKEFEFGEKLKDIRWSNKVHVWASHNAQNSEEFCVIVKWLLSLGYKIEYSCISNTLDFRKN